MIRLFVPRICLEVVERYVDIVSSNDLSHAELNLLEVKCLGMIKVVVAHIFTLFFPTTVNVLSARQVEIEGIDANVSADLNPNLLHDYSGL